MNTNSKPNIVFFGTPDFAVSTLAALVESGRYEISAVVTQTDKPAGRGQKLTPSPVKRYARERSIPVFEPNSLKSISAEMNGGLTPHLKGSSEITDLIDFLNVSAQTLKAFIVVAYGKIIPSSLIHLPKNGTINIHASLLPRWRGAAPIQHAIFAGDKKTGVSIMQIDEGLDTGAIYAGKEVDIAENEDYGSLATRLAKVGADLLLETLPLILSEELKPVAQSNTDVMYADKWEKEDIQLDWSDPAETTIRRIRASSPEPGARTTLDGELVKIFGAHIENSTSFKFQSPGVVIESNKRELIVSAGTNQFISIDELQFPGKKRLAVAEVLKGRSIANGARFE